MPRSRVPRDQEDLDPGDNKVHPDECADFDFDNDMFEEDDQLPHRGGPYGRTDKCRATLAVLPLGVVVQRIEHIITEMRKVNLDLANMTYYVTILQDSEADTGVIKYCRAGFLGSLDFPQLVRKWRNGRDRGHIKGFRSLGARRPLDKFSIDNVNMLINREMRELAPIVRAPIKNLTAENLLELDLQKLSTTMKAKAPVLWSILHNASSTPQQLERNTYKDHTEPIVMMRRCLLQQFNSIYFKASGLAAKAHDTTHAYGVTMSHSWVYDLVKKLSEDARQALFADISLWAWFASQDNLNLAFQVYKQRRNKQSHFDSGTAGTIFVIKDPAVVWPDRLQYQAQRAAVANPRLEAQAISRVIQFLINTPSFDFNTYEYKHDPIFSPLPPRQQLPTGKEHAVCQYLLDTVHLESASQEGTRKCMDEWMRQLKFDSPLKTLRNHPTFKHLLVWIGDQLTTVHIRSIKKDRSEDDNFLDRFEQFVKIFGWFHTQLAEETSFHKQYYKDMPLFGLQHGFEILQRKGLHTTSVKGKSFTSGAFHHGMQEGLRHIAEARFWDLWVIVSKCKSIADLRALPPYRIKAIATRIVQHHASTGALVQQKSKPVEAHDKVFIQSIQFCRDLLDYVEFDKAMKTGDVGCIEERIPRLLFRFSGGKSSNYAIELLELLQGLQKEWPPELRSFIMQYCWLANTTGRPGQFLAFDMLQEHNIRDIKHTCAVHGPFATWEYIKKISASIPIQHKIKDHVEAEINHFR
ncbi:hypothetical protein BC835DRAFT_1306326 [Cytidiella melzeri]|nr:hypothetical protein BC835DRAFT_1306326 [Cytidiella melzeri]